MLGYNAGDIIPEIIVQNFSDKLTQMQPTNHQNSAKFATIPKTTKCQKNLENKENTSASRAINTSLKISQQRKTPDKGPALLGTKNMAYFSGQKIRASKAEGPRFSNKKKWSSKSQYGILDQSGNEQSTENKSHGELAQSKFIRVMKLERKKNQYVNLTLQKIYSDNLSSEQSNLANLKNVNKFSHHARAKSHLLEKTDYRLEHTETEQNTHAETKFRQNFIFDKILATRKIVPPTRSPGKVKQIDTVLSKSTINSHQINASQIPVSICQIIKKNASSFVRKGKQKFQPSTNGQKPLEVTHDRPCKNSASLVDQIHSQMLEQQTVKKSEYNIDSLLKSRTKNPKKSVAKSGGKTISEVRKKRSESINTTLGKLTNQEKYIQEEGSSQLAQKQNFYKSKFLEQIILINELKSKITQAKQDSEKISEQYRKMMKENSKLNKLLESTEISSNQINQQIKFLESSFLNFKKSNDDAQIIKQSKSHSFPASQQARSQANQLEAFDENYKSRLLQSAYSSL